MRIKCSNYVSNVKVLRRMSMISIETVVAATQLRWTRHVARMGENHIPKILLYRELASGNKKMGGQKEGCNKALPKGIVY